MNHAYFPTIFNIGPATDETAEKSTTQTAVSLTEQDWRLLLTSATNRHYKAGEVIIREGEQSPALYLINAGEVRVEQAPGKVLAHHSSGAVFGEMSFLMQKDATASVVATDSVDVSVMDIARVRERLDSTPELAARFYQTLAVALAQRLYQASRLLSQQEM